MSVYDNFADVPNQIRTEGQEITIKFQRTSDTTARISWNIPPPAQGCSADRQAYDGIVITVSNTPANYIGTSPKDGIYYSADPTADYDLHAGDVLDGKAYIIGAFYHDKTTVVLDISGIQPKTPYYVSGYAVDAVGRYHREGVHAYSLPTGIQSYTAIDFPAKHEILLYSINPISLKTPTGLLANTNYTLPVKVECEIVNIPVQGSKAITYGQLVDELNAQFALVTSPYLSPLPKNAGSYYKDGNSFYLWNGHRLSAITVLSLDHTPLIPVEGTYWLDTTTDTLYVYESGLWQEILGIITSATAPTELNSYDVWFDGTTVRVWEDGHWCDYDTFIGDTNPQAPPDFAANDYWFNEQANEFFKWNDMLQRWEDALVVYYPTDPNLLNTGDFWYDETAEKIKQYVGSTWNVFQGILYVDSDSQGDFPEDNLLQYEGGTYWYDTRLSIFYQRNLLNTDWETVQFVSFPTDPKDINSCDLWWNSSPSVDDLYVWEAVTSTWIPVGNFYRQSTDPNVAPLLSDHTAWVKSDGTISFITTLGCKPVNYINSIVNPREIQDGTIWKDNDGNFFIYQSGEWDLLTVVSYASDPYLTTDGSFWYDTIEEKLYKLINGIFVEQCLFTTKALLPTIGDTWYNSVDKILNEWNGTAWVPVSPFIKVQFTQRTCKDEYEKLVFSTRKTGCHESFEVLSENNTLFAALSNSVIYTDPLEGGDGVDAGPMYKQLGVGDDGSPDERRELHEEIRMTFGYPAIRVELTKQQLDKCIDNALLVLRKNSTYAYKKAMFFMDLKNNQQVYTMTNRCVGYNKIVDILAMHRTKAGAFRTAYSQNDNFAFAALQQLYTLGTFDMLTFHLTSSYVEELETLFASRIMYQWLERKRELKIYQVPRARERVLIEAVIERPEQELLSDRETAYWLKRWAIVEAKGMLAQIRGKFATLPGPNGTTTLNASDLQAQLEQERQTLLDEVQSKAMQDLTDIGAKAHFVLG